MQREEIIIHDAQYIVTNTKYTISELEQILQKMKNDDIIYFQIEQDHYDIYFRAYRLETDEELAKRINKTKSRLLKQLKDIEDLEKTL